MKRQGLLLTLIILLTICFVFCSCKIDKGNSPITLSEPVLTIDAEGVASWNAVENAVNYRYKIDGGEEVETDKLSIQIADGESIQVKAVGDGEKYLDSAFTLAQTYTAPVVEPTKLATPVVSIDENGLATWEAVANAIGYVYIINGGASQDAEILSVQLSDGDSLQVIAVGDEILYLSSDLSEAKIYTAPVVEPTKLATPIVSIDESGLATWEEVVNASGYIVNINDIDYTHAKDQLSVTFDGSYTIKIKAVGDGISYIDSDWSETQSFTVPEPEKLSTPIISVDENGLVSWNAVENATTYQIMLCGEDMGLDNILELPLSDGESIKVKAIGDGKHYVDSDWSEEVTYTAPVIEPEKLATPVVSVDENGLATWNAVKNAITYQIMLCGEDMGLDNILELPLSDGESIKVKAIGDGKFCVNSDWSEEITYTAPVIEPEKLATPIVSIDENGLATWNEVSNATTYQIMLCGEDMGLDNILELPLSDGESIKVKAVGDGKYFVDSDWSEEITYTAPVIEPEKLATPIVSVDENGLATWNAVKNAITYQIMLCGEDMGLDDILELQLSDGESIKVKAIGDGKFCVNSDWSEEITYTVKPQNDCENSNHMVEIIEGKPATCTESGLTNGEKCSVCGKVLVEQESIPSKGHEIEEVERVEPTCGNTGIIVTNCKICHEVENYEEVPATGLHTWELVDSENATCVKDGCELYECSVCHADKLETIPATGEHILVEVDRFEPTCVDDGYVSYLCEHCDHEETQVLPATGIHTEVTVEGKNATCTENGLTNGVKCSVCGETLTAQEEIPASGHTEVVDEGKPATCTEDGLTDGKHCSVCGEIIIEQENITAKGHEIEEIERVDPTCGATGIIVTNCKICHEVENYEEIPATGLHTWELVESEDATCVKDGCELYECSVCHADKLEMIPATGEHTLVEVDRFEPTCVDDGYISYLCEHCDHEETQVIPATGIHTEITVEGKTPTCTESGLTSGVVCSVCGETLTAQEEIPALGHTEVVDEGKPATCTEDGLTDGKHCSVCGEVIVEQENIPSKGHEIEEIERVDPTCGATGLVVTNCKVCHGVENYEEIPATGLHTWELVESEDATCIKDGCELYECSVCHVDKTETIPATGEHTLVEVDRFDPTCVDDGYVSYLCEHCDHEETQVLPATGIHTEVTVEGKYATCTENGLTNGVKCSVCGEILTAQEEIPALGHTEVVDEGKPATCTEDGLTDGKYCSVCGEVIVEKAVIEILGHDIVSYESKSATCTEVGWNAYEVCKRCDHTTYEEIPALGHNEITIEGKTPTCTEDGLTDGVVCSVCGETLTAQEEIPASGHTEVVDEGKPATCIEDGLTDGKHCSVCGKVIVEQETIPSKGHEIEEIERVDPTCGDTGIIVTNCKICHEVENYEEIPATGLHTWELIESEDATCVKDGCEIYECSVCHADKTETIPATDEHSLVEVDRFEPTCVDDGYVSYLCEHCDHEETQVILATGIHTEVTVEGKDATCTENGLTNGVKCSVCGETLTAQEEIPSLGHTEVVDEGKPATCTESGLTDGTHCSVCGEVIVVKTVIETLGHDIVNHDGKEATCTEIGWNVYETCTRCDHTTYEEISALGHDVVTHEGKSATCTEIGWQEYETCTRCDHTTYVEIEALGHSYTWTVITEPTAQNKGVEHGVCSNDESHTTQSAVALTVAEAIDLIESNSTELNGRYVLATYAGSYKNGYYISDKGSTVELQVFRPTLGDYTYDEMHVGDAILVKGDLLNYNGTPEFNSGSVIVDYAHFDKCYLDSALTQVIAPSSEYTKDSETLELNVEDIVVDGENVTVAWTIKEAQYQELIDGSTIVLPDTETAVVTLVATLTYGESTTTVEYEGITLVAVNAHIHVYNPANQTCEELIDGVVCGQINPAYLTYSIGGGDKNLVFGASTNQSKVSSYTASFDTISDGMTWTIQNFNNNSNGWNYVKAGRKGSASVATMTATLGSAVTKIVMTIDSVTAANVNSIKLVVTDENGNVIDEISGDAKVGEIEFAISKPQANLTYQIVIDCASGSANGFVQISKVVLYEKGETHKANLDEEIEIISATCSSEGSITFACQNCDDFHTLVIPMLSEHTLGEWIEQTDSSCCADGELAHFHCSVCGNNFDTNKNIIENIIISATGEHVWSEDYDEENSLLPTCTAGGILTHPCATEGCTETHLVEVEALGHIDEDNDGICDRCEENIGALWTITINYVLVGSDTESVDENLISLTWNPADIKLTSVADGTSVILTVVVDGYNFVSITSENEGTEIEDNTAMFDVTENIILTINVAKNVINLDVPEVTVDKNGLASWTAVQNANEYSVYVNGELVKTQEETSYQLNDGETIKVVSNGYENATTVYVGSSESSEVTYTKPEVSEPETATMAITATSGVLTDDKSSISWTSDNITVTNYKNKSTSAILTTDSNLFRCYAKSSLEIKSNGNEQITEVKITCTSSSYATALKNSVTDENLNVTIEGNNVIISVKNDGTVDSIYIDISAQTRINNIEITYIA